MICDFCISAIKSVAVLIHFQAPEMFCMERVGIPRRRFGGSLYRYQLPKTNNVIVKNKLVLNGGNKQIT